MSESRELIWEVSVERVTSASWMQESRLDSRIRASKDEVGRAGVLGVLGGSSEELENWGTVGSRGRSVKLV